MTTTLIESGAETQVERLTPGYVLGLYRETNVSPDFENVAVFKDDELLSAMPLVVEFARRHGDWAMARAMRPSARHSHSPGWLFAGEEMFGATYARGFYDGWFDLDRWYYERATPIERESYEDGMACRKAIKGEV